MKALRVISGLALAAVLGNVFGVAAARAQSLGSWATYAPAASWGAPATIPTAEPPAPASVGTGWQGYAPAAAWATYQPQAAWVGYAPQYGWTASPTAARPRGAGVPISSWNPEFGTGRTIAMIKPWLPASPR